MIKKSKDNKLTFTATFKDILLISLIQATGKLSTISELTAEEAEEGERAIQRIIYLIQSKIITSIDIDPKAGTLKFKVSEVVDKKLKVSLPAKLSFTVVEGNTTTKELDTLFSNKAVKLLLNSMAQELFKITTGDNKTKGKFKRAGHLTDQMLKYNYPPNDKGSQLNIFDSLQEGTKNKIAEVAGVEVTEIVEGIKLSPSETKIIDCLCKLLHDTSQNLDKKKEDYYAGNIGYELVEYGGDKSTPAPKLGFTLYELTREYKGGEYVSGKDIENVKQILTELDNKRFLLSYVETTKKKDGGRIERKIQDFRKLLHILQISQTEYSKENIELSKQEETVILLNPIFRRQIDSKFILYPNDINRRTIIAYGSHNLSEVAIKLRDYLMRELSSKRYEPEISQDKLYYMLAEKWMKESRKKKVKEYTDKALDTVKALGLLISYEIKTASTGEPKVVFKLNKGWE